ncbi:MAG: tRNA uridine-5-carboxymethylaminomethyl(34) synthesis GTPase MnmE [Pseudomonadota bacterium]
MIDTIVALSSGRLPSGVAVIRVSGAQARAVCQALCDSVPKPRLATLRVLRRPHDGLHLDQALVLYFAAPNSFTGLDVVEFHCHGGRATVEAVLDAILSCGGVRLAEPGEFSRQAFENGRLDLTELEGLSDLIAAQTERQRRFALRQAEGALRVQLDAWRQRIVRARAFLEAQFDFSDEAEVQSDAGRAHWTDVDVLRDEIGTALQTSGMGEIAREGFRIALMGKPNVGKSSVLNALAQRDVAIVTDVAGTTRDIVEVSLNINGQLVIFQDTAGLRETEDQVEQEGIRRSYEAADKADHVFWLSDDGSQPDTVSPSKTVVHTKADLRGLAIGAEPLRISTVVKEGVAPLVEYVTSLLSSHAGLDDETLITRARHREELGRCVEQMDMSLNENLDLELRTDHLRRAGDAIGRLTGRIETDDLLDVIFAEFCVGK